MKPRWKWESPLVLAMLLIAFFLRVWWLNDVPPGLHHDEVIIGQVAKDILRGNLAIYFTAGYGHEPLYHYLVAGFFAALGASAFALRLTSAFVAILGLAVAYRFTRRLFSPGVALGALAWMSISLWPIFFSRVGLRGITLPLLTALTAYLAWKSLHAARITHYAFAGAWLGLTLYTYQASRVFPVIFGAFFIYLAITRSSLVTRQSSFGHRIATFFSAAFLVAAPLIVYLTVVNPTAEERVADLSGPLNELRGGNPGEVIRSTLNTLGMFTVRGDAVPIYNVTDRPVFPEPIGAALFYLGFLICAWRWKQPACAFMLIWFFISLIPAMVTPFSPNFVRTIAVWPVPFVFVGVAMCEVGAWIVRRFGIRDQGSGIGDRASDILATLYLEDAASLWRRVTVSPRHLVTIIFVLTLVWNAIWTAQDYFGRWPNGDYVRFWQQANWTQAVRAINADSATTPIAATGLSIHDFDPQTFDLLGVRSDVKVKWFDCRTALLLTSAPLMRYLSPDYFPCNADLWLSYLPDTQIIAQPRWPDTGGKVFTLYEFKPPWSLPEILLPLTVRSVYDGPENFEAAFPTSNLSVIRLPLDVDGLRFWGRALIGDTTFAGGTLTFDTFWEDRSTLKPPLKIFVHVTAPDGRIVAQWDGLDVNIRTLEAGDVFIQRHQIDLPTDLVPGPYRVSLGVYHPDSGQRLIAQVGDRMVDSIILDMLNVK